MKNLAVVGLHMLSYVMAEKGGEGQLFGLARWLLLPLDGPLPIADRARGDRWHAGTIQGDDPATWRSS